MWTHFPQAFPDNAARREVESLPAVCPNQGCSWKGTLKDYEVGAPSGVPTCCVSVFWLGELIAWRPDPALLDATPPATKGITYLLILAVLEVAVPSLVVIDL